MKRTKDKQEEEIKTKEIVLTGHNGRPEFPSYVNANRVHLLSAAELYFSSEEAGQLVHRMCWWLAGYSVRHLEKMMEEIGLDEIYEIIRKISTCPSLMGIGILRGTMMTTFEKPSNWGDDRKDRIRRPKNVVLTSDKDAVTSKRNCKAGCVDQIAGLLGDAVDGHQPQLSQI